MSKFKIGDKVRNFGREGRIIKKDTITGHYDWLVKSDDGKELFYANEKNMELIPDNDIKVGDRVKATSKKYGNKWDRFYTVVDINDQGLYVKDYGMISKVCYSFDEFIFEKEHVPDTRYDDALVKMKRVYETATKANHEFSTPYALVLREIFGIEPKVTPKTTYDITYRKI